MKNKIITRNLVLLINRIFKVVLLTSFGYGSYNQSVDVCLPVAISGKIPNRGRTYDIPIISSDALYIKLSYRKLIGATPLH